MFFYEYSALIPHIQIKWKNLECHSEKLSFRVQTIFHKLQYKYYTLVLIFLLFKRKRLY